MLEVAAQQQVKPPPSGAAALAKGRPAAARASDEDAEPVAVAATGAPSRNATGAPKAPHQKSRPARTAATRISDDLPSTIAGSRPPTICVDARGAAPAPARCEQVPAADDVMFEA